MFADLMTLDVRATPSSTLGWLRTGRMTPPIQRIHAHRDRVGREGLERTPRARQDFGMHDFRRLEVWVRACELASDVYRLTNWLPRTEVFGLSSQMRRAAVSVAANIAEGAARATNADFARFLRIATGSAAELQTHLLIASDIGYLDPHLVDEKVADVLSLSRRIDCLRRTLVPD